MNANSNYILRLKRELASSYSIRYIDYDIVKLPKESLKNQLLRLNLVAILSKICTCL